MFNRLRFRDVLSRVDRNSFVFALSPAEMIYVGKKNSEFVVHSKINSMVMEEKVTIDKDGNLSYRPEATIDDAEEHAVAERLKNGPTSYAALSCGVTGDIW